MAEMLETQEQFSVRRNNGREGVGNWFVLATIIAFVHSARAIRAFAYCANSFNRQSVLYK